MKRVKIILFSFHLQNLQHSFQNNYIYLSATSLLFAKQILCRSLDIPIHITNKAVLTSKCFINVQLPCSSFDGILHPISVYGSFDDVTAKDFFETQVSFT